MVIFYLTAPPVVWSVTEGENLSRRHTSLELWTRAALVFAIASLPSQQPLVNGGEREQFEQQPDGQREEDEGERLDK